MGEVFKLNHCYNVDCVPAMELFPDNYFDLAVVDDANPDNYDLSNVDFFPTVYGSGVSEQDLSALADLQNYRQNIVELPSIGGSDNDTGGNSGGFGGGGSTSFQRTYTSSSGNTYVYSPNFVIYGGMTAEELHSILADDYQRFCENMEQYEREMRRKNYGT